MEDDKDFRILFPIFVLQKKMLDVYLFSIDKF